MSKEAMKLALEWSNKHGEIVFAGGGMAAVEGMNNWVLALQEALAKPDFWEGYVPEPVKPAQQEPVAWMLDGEFYKTQQFHLQGGHYANQIPLYTSPPTQRWTEFNETTKRNIEHAEWYLSTHPEPAQQEPVARQYQNRDGVWKDFISEKHYKDTLEDGSWPIRNLYTSPKPPQRKEDK